MNRLAPALALALFFVAGCGRYGPPSRIPPKEQPAATAESAADTADEEREKTGP